MNLDITAKQAQTLIESQAKEIAELHVRLRRIHVHTKYLERTDVYVRDVKATIVNAIKELTALLDSDQPENSEDYGWAPMYNHSAIEEQILAYEKLISDDAESAPGNRPTINVLSFEFQYAVNAYNEHKAKSIVHHLEEIKGLARAEDEEDTPNFFSFQNGKSNV